MTNTLPLLPAAASSNAASPQTEATTLRLGGLSPLFPVSTVADAGRLRLGGLSPLFPATTVADAARLRLGGLSPLFGRG